MTLREQIENCKKTNNGFEKSIDTEYLGYDNQMYNARATLEIEPCGDWQISIYDYYDPEKEEWIDTGERNEWKEEIINQEFFQDNEEEFTKAETLADMMNADETIPDSAINEFEKDPEGTIKKYKRREI